MKTTQNSKKSSKIQIAKRVMKPVQKSIPATVGATLIGGTGLALISAAAVGVAGFFAWKNREQILSFVGKYVDLPESLKAGTEQKNSKEADESWDQKGSLATVTPDSYTKPTSAHRM